MTVAVSLSPRDPLPYKLVLFEGPHRDEVPGRQAVLMFENNNNNNNNNNMFEFGDNVFLFGNGARVRAWEGHGGANPGAHARAPRTQRSSKSEFSNNRLCLVLKAHLKNKSPNKKKRMRSSGERAKK